MHLTRTHIVEIGESHAAHSNIVDANQNEKCNHLSNIQSHLSCLAMSELARAHKALSAVAVSEQSTQELLHMLRLRACTQCTGDTHLPRKADWLATPVQIHLQAVSDNSCCPVCSGGKQVKPAMWLCSVAKHGTNLRITIPFPTGDQWRNGGGTLLFMAKAAAVLCSIQLVCTGVYLLMAYTGDRSMDEQAALLAVPVSLAVTPFCVWLLLVELTVSMEGLQFLPQSAIALKCDSEAV